MPSISLTLGGSLEGIAWPSVGQATDPRSQARSRHRRIETTSLRKAGVTLSAFTSRLDDAGTPHRQSVGFTATCGSVRTGAHSCEAGPLWPPASLTPMPFGKLPSVMFPRFGPCGGTGYVPRGQSERFFDAGKRGANTLRPHSAPRR
jgi:hypothetical protein